MPAKLVVTEGDPAGREIPIQFPVLRIGSGASCEVQLRGISDVAATLRYDQGRYQVLNRGAEPITLNGQSLVPQQSGVWSARALLRLSAQCALTLEIDGDPAPRNTQPLSRESFDQVAAPAPVEREMEEEEDAVPHDEPAPAKKTDPKKAFQMTVIACCVIGGVLIQLNDSKVINLNLGGSSKSAIVKKELLQQKFALLIEELLQRETPDPTKQGADTYNRYSLLRETLQQGRIAELKESWNEAAHDYRKVLEQMETLELPTGDDDDVDEATGLSKTEQSSLLLTEEEYRKLPLEKRLSEFVRQRLTQIDPKVSKFTDPDA